VSYLLSNEDNNYRTWLFAKLLLLPTAVASGDGSGDREMEDLIFAQISRPLQRYYRLYQILDPVWCFLTKNKTPCSIRNLKRMVCCDEIERDNGATDLKEILQQLAIICDSFLLITPFSEEDLNMEHAIVSYSKFNGIAKSHQEKRLRLMKIALVDYCKRFHELFLQNSNLAPTTSTVSKAWNYKKHNGFHPQFDSDSMVPLPTIPITSLLHTSLQGTSTAVDSTHDDITESDLPQLLQDLKSSSSLSSSQISYIHRIPARSPSFESLIDLSLPSEIYEMLTQDMQIQQLYRHQAQAMRALRYHSSAPRHVIVSTSTASGLSHLSSFILL
jgi:hypothetical protein